MKDATPVLMKVESAALLTLHVVGLAWFVATVMGIA